MSVHPISHSAYRGNEATREAYKPNANSFLVQDYGTASPEYLKIAPYPKGDREGPNSRSLSIISDTFIELDHSQAELVGDSRFIFNALIAARYTRQTARDIHNFGNGFRGNKEIGQSSRVAFNRAIQALDAWALEVSEDILVDRSGWGTGSHPSFMIARDIAIHDMRSSR
ncbi:MAG TPA: hypothetical protein VGE13_03825 [Candidatus Saccharimonadales bacterium]